MLTATPSTIPVDSPPAATIPAVPRGLVPARTTDLQGYSPMLAESELALQPRRPRRARSLRLDCAATFGITAPHYDELVRRLALAVQWTAMLAQTAAWLEYAKSQEGTAWKDALQLVQKLKRPFELATAADPARLGRYPALGRPAWPRRLRPRQTPRCCGRGPRCPRRVNHLATSGARRLGGEAR